MIFISDLVEQSLFTICTRNKNCYQICSSWSKMLGLLLTNYVFTLRSLCSYFNCVVFCFILLIHEIVSGGIPVQEMMILKFEVIVKLTQTVN